ncbi:MAG TPA: FKBP-type peptidyl-prolyl cis-trans isomerase, partial [Pseudolysinimonas sp.]
MRSSTRFKRVPALLGAVALLTASLAGCSLIPGFGGCQPVYTAGDSSTLVTAEGSFGVKPTVSFPTPLVVKTPEVSVIDAGDGRQIRDGDQVDYTFAELTGKDATDLSGDSAESRVEAGIADNAIAEALVCAHVGDRIALVATVKQTHGAGAGGETLDDTDTVVLVIDVSASYLGKADGFNQLPEDGMPTVVTAVDGTPGITVPAQDPPTDTRIGLIKAGDGAKVKAGEQVVLHYTIWIWPATVGDEPTPISGGSTWDSHVAQNLPLKSIADGGGVPQGLYDALLGQRIGSQVLVVIPPGDDSFAPTNLPPGVSSDSTVIFVVDILGI